MERFHILVVCTGNICRSPMTVGMLRYLLPEKFKEIITVSSAGTDALHGNRATDFAIQAMKHYGIDISGHRARRLNRSMVAEADLILAMEQYHLKIIRGMQFFGAGKTHLLSRFDDSRKPYDIQDPIGGGLDLYTESAKLIHNCLDGIYSYTEEHIDA
ncbi:low molecular weight protein-tyrosine-phosphatase [Thermodesulfobacteriota bacterium]